ncbi:MAG: GH3 auxin-responsive promoter family protein [Asgard group archaeon]|nr:GH3 auxin-responsive promoter family protein [Asgard group archaeon]
MDYKTIKQVPFTDAGTLRKVWKNHPIEDIILTERVALWHCTSGSMGNKKWIPWTYNDLKRSHEIVGETLFKFLKPSDRIMSIVLPMPYISGSLPFRLLECTASVGAPLEQLSFAPDYVADSFDLLMRRQPTVVMMTPSLALRMAEEIADNTPKVLKRQAEQEKSLKLRMAAAVTKIKRIKPKRVFKNLRMGYFLGESLNPYREAIENQYGLEAFEFYAFTEGYGGGYECQEHNGLHFPSKNGFIELIPEKELEKEKDDPTYKPDTILLSEAEKGFVGELVLTDFKEALPLVRYRIHDLVKVVAADECSCGDNSPRLKIMGRTDAIINLGVIRFSTPKISQLIEKEFQHGVVKVWELILSRDKFRPILEFRIEPLEVSDEEAFKKEILDSLLSFDIFRIGYERELFIVKDIQLVDKLKLELIGQGKRRKVRYNPSFYENIKM